MSYNFQLRLVPKDFLVFQTDDIFNQPRTTAKLTNTTGKRQIFKVKTTSTLAYRVKPTIAFLKPGETTVIHFYFVGLVIPNGYTPHYFDIYHLATDEEKEPRELWRPTTKADGMQRLMVEHLKANGTPWPKNSIAPEKPSKQQVSDEWLWKPKSRGINTRVTPLTPKTSLRFENTQTMATTKFTKVNQMKSNSTSTSQHNDTHPPHRDTNFGLVHEAEMKIRLQGGIAMPSIDSNVSKSSTTDSIIPNTPGIINPATTNLGGFKQNQRRKAVDEKLEQFKGEIAVPSARPTFLNSSVSEETDLSSSILNEIGKQSTPKPPDKNYH